jgi:lysophospholipase L1-like esterase
MLRLDKNDRLLFLGDSITEMGEYEHGYVTLIRKDLSVRAPSVRILSAGVSGDTVRNVNERIDDALSAQPNAVVVYIGINDVWGFLGWGGTTEESFRAEILHLVRRLIQKSRVMLCTVSVIGERRRGANESDSRLDQYSQIIREIAQQFSLPVCDLRRRFLRELEVFNASDKEQGILTSDGVHLNNEGNRVVADEILKMISLAPP